MSSIIIDKNEANTNSSSNFQFSHNARSSTWNLL